MLEKAPNSFKPFEVCAMYEDAKPADIHPRGSYYGYCTQNICMIEAPPL